MVIITVSATGGQGSPGRNKERKMQERIGS